PCELVTRHISGATYPTISLIYPYMHLLKKKFAPTDNHTIEDYMDLVYGLALSENMNKNNEIEEIALIATILDPRLKGLRFVNQEEHINIQEKLKEKYQELKYSQDNILSTTQNRSINQNKDTNINNIFDNMWAPAKQNDDPLVCISAISVPSERLFSDVNAYISARRTRLCPNLLESLIWDPELEQLVILLKISTLLISTDKIISTRNF
ncbi:12973_t:CDS:2, partial [Dentiscutata erythropus]